MIPVKGVYEVAVRVKDLNRAENFYCGVLGLQVGLRDEARKWLFLRAGGLDGMVVLQEESTGFARQHFAFTVSADDVDFARQRLAYSGIRYDGPVVHEWIPAISVYFSDPDGHELEFCAPLERSR